MLSFYVTAIKAKECDKSDFVHIKCTEYHVKIQVKKNAQPYKQTKKKKKINTPDGLKSR